MLTKKAILSEMQGIHDELKNHPYRLTFSIEDVSSYKHTLLALADAWVTLTYKCVDISKDEKSLLRHFLYWYHNYNAYLKVHEKEKIQGDLLVYYDAMLHITHEYLERGILDTFYNIEKGRDANGSFLCGVKYVLVTEEMCGVKCEYLPSYIPVSMPYSVKDDAGRLAIERKVQRTEVTQEYKDELFNTWWIKTEKPLREWVNKNLVNSSGILFIVYI